MLKLIVLFSILGSVALSSAHSQRKVVTEEDKMKVGEELYKKTCISCHTADGSANHEINLLVKPRALKHSILTEEQTAKIIEKGAKFWGAHSHLMPAFLDPFNKDEIDAIAHYISKTFNPNVKQRIQELLDKEDKSKKVILAKAQKKGKKIYNRNCSWCHGLDGKGEGEATRNPEMSIFPYNLTKTLLTEDQMFLYTKYGGKRWGTDKTDMPSWKKKYDDYTLRSVVAYIMEELRDEKSTFLKRASQP